MTHNDFHAAPTLGPDPDRTSAEPSAPSSQPGQPPAPPAAVPTPTTPPQHEDFGPYRIQRCLGEGGFGMVFLAEQTEPVRRHVAVKVIKPGMDTRAVLSRFEAERQAVAMMDHPGIAKVLDAGSTPAGRPYFAMELVRGVPLTEYCDQRRLSTRDRLALFIEVCHAVQHAHQKGIIHRDLKPSNILVTDQDGRGAPKIIDFGIAKAMHARLVDNSYHTAQGQFVGTPEYTSPEQADSDGLDVDTRSDIYSLGVILYELLTGVLPIDSSAIRGSGLKSMSKVLRDAEPAKPSTRLADLPTTATDSAGTPASRLTPGTPADIAKRRGTDPRSLSRQLKGDLDWIIMKAMDKERARRYESAGSFADDIQRHLASEPVVAGPPTTTYRIGKFLRRNRVGVSIAAVLLLLLTVGFTAVSVLYRRSESQRQLAQTALTAEGIQRQRAENALKSEEEQRQRAQSALRAEADQRQVAEKSLLSEETQRQRAETALKSEADQRRKAETETKKLNAAVEFLNSMFTAIDPANAKGREVTVREVIDTAAQRVGEELTGQPEVEAYIREMLGESYNALSNFDEADRQLEKSLEIRQTLRSPDDSELLRLYSKRGAVLISRGKPDEAEKMLRVAYDGRSRTMGPSHPETLASLSLLSMVQQDRGDIPGAAETIRQVIAGQQASIGPAHRETLESRCSLADMLNGLGRLEEAEKEAAETAKIAEDSLGGDDPVTLQAQSIRGSSLYNLGRYEEAERVLLACAQAKARVYGEQHSSSLLTLNILGMTQKKLGKLEEAEETAQRVYDYAKASLGAEHPATLSYLSNLAQAEQARGNFEQAEAKLREAVALRTKVSGPEHVATLSALNNLGLVLCDQKRFEEALPILQQVREGVEKTQPPTHWMVGASRTFVGDCLTDLKRYDEAEPLLLSAWEQLGTAVGHEHPRAKTTAKALAKLYTAMGKPDAAAEWSVKAGSTTPAAPPATK